ncbi:unknown [Alistipes sp. CAG:831]|nr:unknown [Alistipes sp. CAG:831]
MCSAPEAPVTEFSTMNSTPARLTPRPSTPCHVIRSFSTTAATTIVITGVISPSTEASTAVVIVIAFRKANCVRNSPRSEATAIFQRSPLSTLSRLASGKHRDITQNSTSAPADRIRNSDIGGTWPSLAMFLQHTILNPKIR